MFMRTLLFVCLWSSAAHALATRLPHHPVRMIVADQAVMPIEVQELTVRTDISGGMAETRVSMVFYNPNGRQLEGKLQFPLVGNQQITSFALDIHGQMRAAVPVAKEKGREVFEAIERRQVDPGLLEVTQGNNFSLRVYPIAARSTRTVELTIAEPLERRGAHWAYTLPLQYGSVQKLDVALRVNDSAAEPVVNGLTPGLVFVADKGGYTASLKREREAPPAQIEILTRAATEPRVYRQQHGNDTYFLAEIPVSETSMRRKAPRVIGLLWDSSGSGSARDTAAEIAELATYLATLRNVDVRLTRLRDRAEPTEQFRIAGGDTSALRRALEATVYDGASSLGDWKPENSVDQYLLVSDGLTNYGNKRLPQLAAHQRLFALSSAAASNSNWLAAVAERAGGRLISVDRNAAGAASTALLTADTHVAAIDATGADQIEFESRTVAGGMLRVTGRIQNRNAALTLTLANGASSRNITIALPADAALHPYAANAWAGFRLRSLEADGDLQLAEMGRIGRRFSIPTRETSLIVLEQVSDYVRYDIEPPEALAAEYRDLKAKNLARLDALRSKQFETVVRRYENRKAWWDKDFTRPPPTKKYLEPIGMGTSRLPRPPDPPAPPRLPVPVGAPPPAPVPMAEAAARESQLARRSASASAKAAPESKSKGIGIALKKWEADAPYIERMKRAGAGDTYRVYLDQKPDYANSSAFFLDAADILLEKGQRALALRVLSNLSEMDLENRAVLRILGYRLLQANAPELAVPVFEHVLRIAGEEPQSYRDLGLALAAVGRHQAAIDTLYEVVVKPWANRFPDIENTALAEINALVATSPKKLDVSRIDPRLRINMPLDVRVVLTWDADNTDMDLHVTDPSGEVASYRNSLTRMGGRMSHDFTGGYGPEEFALRRSEPGKYKIAVNYFGSRQQVIAGATTVQVKLFTHFGTSKQKEQLMTLRLQKRQEMVYVGEFDVK
jgi:Ca-activated chloride channel family protein